MNPLSFKLICQHDDMMRARIQCTGVQAREEERSMTEPVRESVEEYLARRPIPDVRGMVRRARAMKGRFRSGCPDLAEAHDRHLDDAFDV